MSIGKAQAEAIAEGFLDDLGSGKEGPGMPVVEGILAAAAQSLIEDAVRNLDAAGAVATGQLAGITFQITRNDAAYTLAIGYPAGSPAAEYYDFVNLGVQGLDANPAPGSPYAFRTRKVSRKMANDIMQWYKQQGRGAANVKKPKTGKLGVLESKRKGLKDTIDKAKDLKSLAYATAVNIKKKGRKPTHYFNNAVLDNLGPGLRDALAVALKAEVIIELRKIAT